MWKKCGLEICQNITMNHSSMKLNGDQVPGAKLTVDLEKSGKNEAVWWLKCRIARNLSRLNLTEL